MSGFETSRPKRLRIAWLPDGKRLRLQDGPVDLVIQGFGRPGDIGRAYDAAIARTRGLLDELYSELEFLCLPAPQSLEGRVAQRMNAAVVPFCAHNVITPMAAIAGAVADDVLAAMREAAPMERVFVNNGGDIALCLAPGQTFTVSGGELAHWPMLLGTVHIRADSETRGIATSGWTGDRFSRGIADEVTVTAANAAIADAAATIIANAVDLPGHPAIQRVPASALRAEDEGGEWMVTAQVGPLSAAEQLLALEAGAQVARTLCQDGLICGAALRVKGEVAVVHADQDRAEHFLV
ncbi:MAG: hypothetical protein B7X08_06330 [Acidocella sp. 20-63-7]|nr:MAG: hypothetical protein B7X08_06330 [Acidocella sp. 20-63-7]HQT45893.1 UPF0280 family protein [Acidocella sp.]